MKLKNLIIGLIIMFSVILLDQTTKILFDIILIHEGKYIEVIPNFFKFELVKNTGMSFGLLKGKFELFMAITIIATIIFGVMCYFADFKKAPVYSVSVYFMVGGMIGNLIDRIFRPNHAVIDFISFSFFKAIFNVADCFLVIGVAMLMFDILFLESKRKEKEFIND